MFSNGKWNKNVTTVGEVVAELSLLDPNLPVHSTFVESVDLVVFNRNHPNKHLGFCDGKQWDDGSGNVVEKVKEKCTCCARGDEYNGFGSDGPLLFHCDLPNGCCCHD